MPVTLRQLVTQLYEMYGRLSCTLCSSEFSTSSHRASRYWEDLKREVLTTDKTIHAMLEKLREIALPLRNQPTTHTLAHDLFSLWCALDRLTEDAEQNEDWEVQGAYANASNQLLDLLNAHRLLDPTLITVRITKDGNAWCALVGPDLQSGYAGFGNSPSHALKLLADAVLNAPTDQLDGSHTPPTGE